MSLMRFMMPSTLEARKLPSPSSSRGGTRPPPARACRSRRAPPPWKAPGRRRSPCACGWRRRWPRSGSRRALGRSQRNAKPHEEAHLDWTLPEIRPPTNKCISVMPGIGIAALQLARFAEALSIAPLTCFTENCVGETRFE